MSDEPPRDLIALARGIDAEALEREVLLLAAIGIPYELVVDGDDTVLVVDTAHAERARQELAAVDEDEPAREAPALQQGARAALPTGTALVAFHVLLGLLPADRRAAIYRAGELDGVKVHAGEIYRIVTALTLHADPAHVVGNALATAIFVSAAGDWVGPGVALLCTILAGIVGNALAVVADPHHLAIGFSTATFGALGLTAVFGFVARYRDRIQRRRAWLALGAGIALLALLGAGEKSDLLAHIFGLTAGTAIGVIVARGRVLHARQPIHIGAVGQWLASFAAIAMIVAAWTRAFAQLR